MKNQNQSTLDILDEEVKEKLRESIEDSVLNGWHYTAYDFSITGRRINLPNMNWKIERYIKL